MEFIPTPDQIKEKQQAHKTEEERQRKQEEIAKQLKMEEAIETFMKDIANRFKETYNNEETDFTVNIGDIFNEAFGSYKDLSEQEKKVVDSDGMNSSMRVYPIKSNSIYKKLEPIEQELKSKGYKVSWEYGDRDGYSKQIKIKW